MGAKAEKKSTETVPRNRQMFGQILSSVTGQQSAAKTSRNGNQKKQLTGEIDWELEAIRSAQNSWKDELCAIDYAAALVV